MVTTLGIVALAVAAAWLVSVLAAWLLVTIASRRAETRTEPPAEIPVGTWTCPDCDVEVPLTATPQTVRVLSISTLDVGAHALTHEEDA